MEAPLKQARYTRPHPAGCGLVGSVPTTQGLIQESLLSCTLSRSIGPGMASRRQRMTRKQRKRFVFRKHDNIGAADAIDDRKFLEQSFVDNGELDILRDNERPECVIVGRTGSGKTALLERLDSLEERVIRIAPEDLSLTYVSNNNVLGFFKIAGVDLDLFYRFLWRHVFAVELIRVRYNIVNEESRDSFLVQIKERILGNRSRREAIDYLVTWGESFWKDTEHRVKEITRKLEQELGASLGGTARGSVSGLGEVGVTLTAEMAKTLTEEEKAEVIQRGQSVVDQVQMRVLSEIIRLLENDILDDPQKKYYITIDRLDENWVHDDLRYELIRALFETVRDFNNHISNVKILVAIREDLIDRVFRYTRSPGYQEEKYKSMHLPLTWEFKELEEMLDRRVNQLVREQYTTRRVTLKELLPSKVRKRYSVKFLLERTLFVPRDAIMFFNECIGSAAGKAKITSDMMFQAETRYSSNRLRALADEWSSDYPNLVQLALFLKGFSARFTLSNPEVKDRIEECLLRFLCSTAPHDYIYSLGLEKFDADDIDGFLQGMFKLLYRVGIVGVRQGSQTGIAWSFQRTRLVGSRIEDDTAICVHPAFYSVLGIQDGK
jgi:hypothetical protein